MYVLIVVGPDLVPGCEGGAEVTFYVDGRKAMNTAVNALDRGKTGGQTDLIVP